MAEETWTPIFVQELKHKVYPIIGCCQTVHKLMGPFLNEYMYQDALQIEFDDQHLNFEKEAHFTAQYKGRTIKHPHYVDFHIMPDIYLECKAVETLGDTQRQQLWNYMRLSNMPIGILYNFAPIMAQCEKYYYDIMTKTIKAF